jgi:hypothetical protein
MFIIYTIVFIASYFAIGFGCDRLGVSLPGDVAIATAGGVVVFQTVKIILANVAAAIVVRIANG